MDGQNFENKDNYQDNTGVVQDTPVTPTNNAPAKQTDALAIVSLVAGIVSIILACCSPYIGIILGVVGIVCAVISKKNNGKSGLATAGLICSIVGIVFGVIMLIIAFAGLAILSDMGIDYNSLY